jgi:hypothetical protein
MSQRCASGFGSFYHQAEIVRKTLIPRELSCIRHSVIDLEIGTVRYDEHTLLLVFRCEEIPERLQNAFAALAGSGPAYIYQVDHALCKPC